MKTRSSLFTLVLAASAPAIAAWSVAGGAFFAESIVGSYAIVGALCIAALDYKPRTLFAQPRSSAVGIASWTRTQPARARRGMRAQRPSKISAGV